MSIRAWRVYELTTAAYIIAHAVAYINDAAANCGSLKRTLYIQATRSVKIDLGPATSEVSIIVIAGGTRHWLS